MKSFYTNVQTYGSYVLYRGIENGVRQSRKIKYLPTLFLPSEKPTKYTTVDGQYVDKIMPGTIRETKDFCKKYEGVDGFKIYGNQKYEYTFISDISDDEVNWDMSYLNIANIDIEVGSENGFPNPKDANEEIQAITIKQNNKFIVFACGDYDNSRSDVTYIDCDDEIELIKRFLAHWTGNYPDVVTGWNIRFFDIPYLVNRITKILGESVAKSLSPWDYLGERRIFVMGREQVSYNISGVSVLDYLDLYKKFAPRGQSQESYKLNDIAQVELGEGKLSYEEYGNLHTLYKTNFQLFIKYNIRDVELIDKLELKLKLIELALTLAYDSKTNYDDVFTQVRMWDSIIFNHLKKKNVVLPPIRHNDKDMAYVGAFVKDPLVGMHRYIASFDLNSLYPSLIIQYNISPDTIVEPENYTDVHRELLRQKPSIDTLLNQSFRSEKLKELGCTLTPNGQFFRTDKQGFLGEIMATMYDDRVRYKKQAGLAKKELENVENELKSRGVIL